MKNHVIPGFNLAKKKHFLFFHEFELINEQQIKTDNKLESDWMIAINN